MKKRLAKWLTSIQYGTGAKFKHQEISDNFYPKLRKIIKGSKKGELFIKIINNGFSEKIAHSSLMQKCTSIKNVKMEKRTYAVDGRSQKNN